MSLSEASMDSSDSEYDLNDETIEDNEEKILKYFFRGFTYEKSSDVSGSPTSMYYKLYHSYSAIEEIWFDEKRRDKQRLI